MPYQIDFIHIPYTYNYVRMLHRQVYRPTQIVKLQMNELTT